MNKIKKVIIDIIAIAGILLFALGCVNLYAASVQERQLVAAIALSLVIILGIGMMSWKAKRKGVKGKTTVKCIGLGCLVPETVSLAFEWSSVEQFFIWNIAFVAFSIVIGLIMISMIKMPAHQKSCGHQ